MRYEDHGIHINSEGTEVRAICPECTPGRKPQHQHEKDLCVNTEKGTWYCQHCGWSGGLKKQQEQEVYHRPTYDPSGLNEKLLKYFEKRGISKGTLHKCRIGYMPGSGNKPGAVMFPRYKDGKCVAIKYRTHEKKMWQSKNPEPCFFNYDMAMQSTSDTLVICEGEIDCLSFIEGGIDCVVSVPDGAPAPNAKSFENKFKFLEDKVLEKFETFIIAVDNDEGGKLLESELGKRIGEHRCLKASMPYGCKDANDVVKVFGAEALNDILAQAKPFPIDGLFSPADVKERVQGLYREGLKSGNSTGWACVDRYYTVRKCEFTVVTGVPGSGKSNWLDALAVKLMKKYNWKTAFCSPENWPIERHIAGIIEKYTHKPFAGDSHTSKRLSPDELNAAIQKIEKNLFFTEIQEKDMSIDGILKIMQGAISRHGVDGIVLDPWNELEYHRPQHLSETEFVSEALGKIRRFARMNNVHVWVVAHPMKLRKNDDGTYPVPRMYDISGSAHWYNKADNGIAVHRWNMKAQEVNIYIQKIRFKEVGRLGDTMLRYVYDTGDYLEADDEYRNKKDDKEIF